MTRRKDLKGIAAGVINSFISRNNDVGGYWGIGKIWAMIQNRGGTVASIDLISLHMEPGTSEFDSMIQAYRQMLERIALKKGVDPTWIRGAQIELLFKPERIKGRWYDPPVNEIEFTAKMKIFTDLGSRYEVAANGHCRPHNPKFGLYPGFPMAKMTNFRGISLSYLVSGSPGKPLNTAFQDFRIPFRACSKAGT